jgi:cellobiose phosphorylase
VWLGFFSCEVMNRFAEVAQLRGDEAFAKRCHDEVQKLTAALEQHGWDGEWFRRAYFDDGTPLGSSANAECRIDSIAQSWSVLSGIAAPARARQAMAALHAHLVRPEARLVQLLDPPFDQHGPNPGYIAGYVPGVRENGGQYTHGAIWAAMAFAAMGDGAHAWSLLDLINPVRHGDTPEASARYKVEPYVMAADVYGVDPHTGRGGWSWYTGSAGWMYRLIVESLLGLRLETSGAGPRLHLAPCLPATWPGYSLHYRRGAADYAIEVTRQTGRAVAVEVHLDGVLQAGASFPLVADASSHRVVVRCLAPAESREPPPQGAALLS